MKKLLILVFGLLIVGSITAQTKNFGTVLTIDNLFVGNICYKFLDQIDSSNIGGGSVPNNGNIGSFENDIYLIVYPCENPDCFKVIYVPKPDCKEPPLQRISVVNSFNLMNEVRVVPNPVISGEMEFISTYPNLNMGIYNSQGNLIHKSKMEGSIYRWNINHLSPGVYIVKYATTEGIINTIKFVKL